VYTHAHTHTQHTTCAHATHTHTHRSVAQAPISFAPIKRQPVSVLFTTRTKNNYIAEKIKDQPNLTRKQVCKDGLLLLVVLKPVFYSSQLCKVKVLFIAVVQSQVI